MQRFVSQARWVVVGGLAILMFGCQSYRPQPTDLAAHIDTWKQRDLASAEVSEFAKRLAAQDANPAPPLDISDGLSMHEAQIVALVFNPDLRLARLRAGVRAASAEHAGRWNDPVIGLDVERILQSVPEPWVVAGSIGLTIPISGRYEVAKSLAGAEHMASLQQVALEESQTFQNVQSMWIEWSALRLQENLTESFVTELEGIITKTRELVNAGELDGTQAALFELELARRRHQWRLTAGQRRETELSLRGLMGLSPEAMPGVEWLPNVVVESRFITEAEIRERATELNPLLALRRAEYEIAERAYALEIREQYPDVTIGPGYGTDEGDSRLLLGLHAPLPIFNANRQAIAEARAEREVARAALETEYERLMIELARSIERLETAQEIRRDIETSVSPLADRQLQDAQRLAELGELAPLLLLESVVRAHDTRLSLIEARLRESLAATAINEIIGPAPMPQPSAPQTTTNQPHSESEPTELPQ